VVLAGNQDRIRRGDQSTTLLCDFHIHTICSDGSLSPIEVVRLHGDQGFDVISITDHVYGREEILGRLGRRLWPERKNFIVTEEDFPGYLSALKEAREYAWEEYQMILIPGAEICRDRFFRPFYGIHIVIIDIQQYINPELPPLEILKEGKRQGAVTVVAHPYPYWAHLLHPVRGTLYGLRNKDELSPFVDGWEIGNQRRIYQNTANLPGALLGASDFHVIADIRGWKTAITCKKDKEAVKEALRENRGVEPFFFQPKEGSLIGQEKKYDPFVGYYIAKERYPP